MRKQTARAPSVKHELTVFHKSQPNHPPFLMFRPYGRKQGNGGTRKMLGRISKLRLKGRRGFGGSFSCLSPQGTRDFR
jgi:hypothetical protein